jgi:hypothetical protein
MEFENKDAKAQRVTSQHPAGAGVTRLKLKKMRLLASFPTIMK